MKLSTLPEKGTIERERLIAFLHDHVSNGNDPREIADAEIDGDTVTLGHMEFRVLTDEEANEACADYVKDSLWAFNASFILEECGLDFSGEESLKAMQNKACENANDFILSLVEKTCGLESFVDAAVSADGRGHFLSGYDGNENEVKVNGKYWYVYRIN